MLYYGNELQKRKKKSKQEGFCNDENFPFSICDSGMAGPVTEPNNM
jgi:hypothetical protein